MQSLQTLPMRGGDRPAGVGSAWCPSPLWASTFNEQLITIPENFVFRFPPPLQSVFQVHIDLPTGASTTTGSTSQCWYPIRGTGHWNGDRKKTTLWQIASKGQDAETVHGTQKPVECMCRAIENNSSPGQAVYEPFSGSGTTIIAAEIAGRASHAVELSPAHVDVAVLRWQVLTGQQAVLEGNGASYAATAAACRAEAA